jgi:ubiquinone/menaquinone biosynthesis C-methylase UbiE
MDLLRPQAGDLILDAGCGTGVFTEEILAAGARVTGLDLSLPMVRRASEKLAGFPFAAALGDILHLPFPDTSFDKVVSVTAMEFLADGHAAVRELFRVARKGGTVLVATLNSLSPWAARRRERAERGQSDVFKKVIFRSPEEMIRLGPANGEWRTAIHFLKDEDPARAPEVEEAGRIERRNAGAFLAVRWMV